MNSKRNIFLSQQKHVIYILLFRYKETSKEYILRKKQEERPNWWWKSHSPAFPKKESFAPMVHFQRPK